MKIFLIFIFLFLLFPPTVLAQVVINEFSSSDTSDWVEIYNVSPNEVALSGWVIRDTASTPVHEFSTERIPAGTSCFQSVSNRLNNGGDKIMLLNGSTQIDCVAYGDGNGSFCGVSADVVAPSSGQTASRVPDGTGGWVLGSSSKSTISCESLVPTPTPIPTESSTQAPTSAPTATPTSTPTPTPTKTPTPSPKVLAKSTPATQSEVLGEEVATNVSDLRNQLMMSSPTATPQIAGEKKFPIFPAFLIIGGLACIAFAGFTVFRNLKGRYNDGNEENY